MPNMANMSTGTKKLVLVKNVKCAICSEYTRHRLSTATALSHYQRDTRDSMSGKGQQSVHPSVVEAQPLRACSATSYVA